MHPDHVPAARVVVGADGDLAGQNDEEIVGAQPRAEILGILALNDPDNTVTEDDLLALRHGSIVLALELSHQRTVAEIELHLRRDLVDDLLTGTDQDGPTLVPTPWATTYDGPTMWW